LRRSQGRKAAGEIFQGRFTEVGVGVVGEKRTVDCSLLKALEDFLCLLQLRGLAVRGGRVGDDATGSSQVGHLDHRSEDTEAGIVPRARYRSIAQEWIGHALRTRRRRELAIITSHLVSRWRGLRFHGTEFSVSG